jgi:hypothetical protein
MRCVDIPGRSPESSLDQGGVCDCVCARGVGARSSLILLLSVMIVLVLCYGSRNLYANAYTHTGLGLEWDDGSRGDQTYGMPAGQSVAYLFNPQL